MSARVWLIIQPSFECEICEQKFQTIQTKRKHITIVHGEVKHLCNVCNKIFRRKNQLNFHLKNYHQEGQRKYKCDSCEKTFNESRSLKNHFKKLHEEQNLCKCDSCGKSFTTSEYLKTYIKTIH